MPLAHIPEMTSGKFGIAPQSTVAATVNGSAVDRTQFRAAKLSGLAGAASGTPTTQSVIYKLQDSADGSTGWADFGTALADLDGDNEIANGNFDLAGAKKFVRAVATVAFTGGTSPEQLIGAVLILMGAQEDPATP